MYCQPVPSEMWTSSGCWDSLHCVTRRHKKEELSLSTLTFYGINFPGRSGLFRRTCMKYGLPNPLQYLQHPWSPDRWRSHCKKVVQDYWDNKLQAAAETATLKYFDLEYASTSVPMRVWQLAGLCSESVRKATIVSWMILGGLFLS